MSYAEVLEATLDYPTLSAVKEVLLTDRVGTQLTVTIDGLVLKGSHSDTGKLANKKMTNSFSRERSECQEQHEIACRSS